MHQWIKFILFWNDNLYVSDGLSVHHQEFNTVHTATRYCCLLASGYPLASRQQVASEIGNVLTGWETTDVFKIALFDWCDEFLQDFCCSSQQGSTKQKWFNASLLHKQFAGNALYSVYKLTGPYPYYNIDAIFRVIKRCVIKQLTQICYRY